MATIRCPECGYSESDGRPHDRETYPEVCVRCTRKMCGEFKRDNPAIFERKV